MSAEPVFGPEPLDSHHELDGFDCGIGSLNDYLVRRAFSDQRAGKSRTYVIACGRRVVGYFSVAASSIEPQDASHRVATGQGAQAIPAVLIGRLAVDSSAKGQGLGEALLVEALRKCVAAAETIGVRVVLVDALDDDARGFYAKYGFEASPIAPHHLMLLMKDVRQTLGRSDVYFHHGRAGSPSMNATAAMKTSRRHGSCRAPVSRSSSANIA